MAFLGCLFTCTKQFWNYCMSVSLLFGILPYWNYTNLDNSSSGWDIFLKFLGDIIETFIHKFQIILIFFVCQCVSRLLPYWNYTKMGLSLLLDEIHFWKFWETLVGCLHTNSKYFWISCMSVSLLVCYFLTEIRQIWRYLHFWMRYISAIFLDIPWTFVH